MSLSYSVGVAEPVSVRVRIFGTGEIDGKEITKRIREVFDFRVAAIVRDLELCELPAGSKDGFYQQLVVYGQMDRTDLTAPREKTDTAS